MNDTEIDITVITIGKLSQKIKPNYCTSFNEANVKIILYDFDNNPLFSILIVRKGYYKMGDH